MRRALFLLLVVLTLGAPAYAEEAKPAAPAAVPDPSQISVKAELNKAFITIGDPVEYVVTIRHAPEVQVLSSIPYPPSDIFKLKKIEEFSNEDGGMKIAGKKFILTAFQLGEYILEPVEIEFRPKGGEVQKIKTGRIFLTVKSVAGGKEITDIRGLKGIHAIPRKILGGILLLLGLLALFLIPSVYAWWKKKAAQPPVPKRILSSEEEALQELSRLFDSDLIRQGKVKEYYLRFSEILRGYLERRHSIQAIESTTFEILSLLRGKNLSGILRSKIKDVLEFSDLAKFAKWKPDAMEILTYNKRAREIVEESAPAAAPDREVRPDGV